MPSPIQILQQKIRQCSSCPLREGCSAPVPGFGPSTAKIMIVGEAPGATEDKYGVPFCGDAGDRLEKLLSAAEVKREDVYLTNILRCRPPGNRTPKKKEIRQCYPWLLEEIKLIKPTTLITLGATPLSLFSPYPISQMHGTQFDCEVDLGEDDAYINK